MRPRFFIRSLRRSIFLSARLAWCCCLALLAVPAMTETPPVPIDIAVTIDPQAYLVERIGGDRVRVHVTVAPGQSPETYQPTDSDAGWILKSRFYFRLGLPAERGPWLKAIERSDRVRIVDLRRGLRLRTMEGIHHDHSHGEVHRHADPAETRQGSHHHEGPDPHVWLSPRRLCTMAETIAEELSHADPTFATDYRRNVEQLCTELTTLDQDLRQLLKPCRKRAFFVYHPAWGYLADDYDLRQIAIEVEGKKPSDVELTRLQRLAREHRARTVFVQPQITGRAVHAVAAAVDAQVEVIDPLARDIPANLRHVAQRLVVAFETCEGP